MLNTYISLLKICDSLFETISIFIGAKHIEVGGKHMVFIDMLLDNHEIRKTFFNILAIGLAFVVIFALINAFKNNESDVKLTKKVFLARTIKSIGIYFLVPIAILLFIHGVAFSVSKVEDILHKNMEHNHLSIGNTMFMLSSFGKEKEYIASPSFLDESRKMFYEDNEAYYDIDNVNAFFEFDEGHTIVSIVVVSIFIIVMIFALFTFIKGVFDLVVLFILSPYLAVTAPLDNGEILKKWLRIFAAKLCVDFGVIITFNIFINIIMLIILNNQISFSNVLVINTGVMLLLLIGGSIAVINSHEFTIDLFHEQFEKIG